MKLKMVIVDFEMSPRGRRVALCIGIPVLILGVAAVAYANVPNVFESGQVLTAAALNADFALHDTEIAALQADVTALQATHGVTQVLEAEPVAATVMIPSNGSGAPLIACPTAPYTPTTTGETALIWVEGNALQVPSGSGLAVNAAYNTGAGMNTAIGYSHYAGPFDFTQSSEQLNVGRASALALTMGTTYRFETAASDPGGHGYSSTYDCSTVVEIVTAPLEGGPH